MPAFLNLIALWRHLGASKTTAARASLPGLGFNWSVLGSGVWKRESSGQADVGPSGLCSGFRPWCTLVSLEEFLKLP